MYNSEILRIKEDILKIINENVEGMCLCGRGEWCEYCSVTSPKDEKLKYKLKEYLASIE